MSIDTAALAAERAAHADDAKELNRLDHLLREESNARERAESQLKLSQAMHARAAERAKRAEAKLKQAEGVEELVRHEKLRANNAEARLAESNAALITARAQVERLRELLSDADCPDKMDAEGFGTCQDGEKYVGGKWVKCEWCEAVKQALADTAPANGISSGICDFCGKYSEVLYSVNEAPMAGGSICGVCAQSKPAAPTTEHNRGTSDEWTGTRTIGPPKNTQGSAK